jgi:hypothetical protein
MSIAAKQALEQPSEKEKLMKLRILTLAALMTFVGTASNPASASEEGVDTSALSFEELRTDTLEFDAEDPTAAPRRPRWDDRDRRGRSYVCYARNARGRTFAAHGNWRTPQRWVQQRALDQCRRSSGFFRWSCRAVGCRSNRW